MFDTMKGFAHITPSFGMPELLDILASSSEFEGISLVFSTLFAILLLSETIRERGVECAQQVSKISSQGTNNGSKDETQLRHSGMALDDSVYL